MRTLTRRIDSYVEWVKPISRDFQLGPSNGYRHKSVKSVFREYGYQVHHNRGLRRTLACLTDDRWEQDGMIYQVKKRNIKEIRCRLSSFWSEEHNSLCGFKSWKKRCRKRHQWEHHRHSSYELWLLNARMGYFRSSILDILCCNGGCYTFNIAHRPELEHALRNMERASDILLEYDHGSPLHCQIRARLP